MFSCTKAAIERAMKVIQEAKLLIALWPTQGSCDEITREVGKMHTADDIVVLP